MPLTCRTIRDESSASSTSVPEGLPPDATQILLAPAAIAAGVAGSLAELTILIVAGGAVEGRGACEVDGFEEGCAE